MHWEIIGGYFNIFFLLKYNWKKKTLKVFFGVPDFGQPNTYIDLPNDLNISLISKEMINFIIICRVILLILALLFENCSLTKAHKITYSLLFKLIWIIVKKNVLWVSCYYFLNLFYFFYFKITINAWILKLI